MDFIDRLRQEAEQKRREAEEAAKRPRPLKPWQIKRQEEEKERERKYAIALQYFIESGCQSYCEKLKAFLEGQGCTKVHFALERVSWPKDVGGQLEFYWHTPIQHDFKVEVKVDGSLVFTGRRPSIVEREAGRGRTTTCAVTIDEWRNSKQPIDRAFEKVYHDPEVWDAEYREGMYPHG